MMSKDLEWGADGGGSAPSSSRWAPSRSARAPSSSQQWHRPVYGATETGNDDDDSYDGYPAAPSHRSTRVGVDEHGNPVYKESTMAWFFRASEPIVFWAACTLIAAFSCISIVRITRSPHFPASLPEGRDGRSIQVGYIANSTEAVNAFKGCVTGRGGDVLRSDMGRDRFPDFIVAGSRGAPQEELHSLLDEKNVACAAQSPFDDFFSDPKWRTPGAIPLKDQKAYVKDNYARCSREDKYLGAPRFQTNEDLLYAGWAPRRMCETMGPDESRALLLLSNPVEHALTVFAGTLENTPERVFNGWIRRSEAALMADQSAGEESNNSPNGVSSNAEKASSKTAHAPSESTATTGKTGKRSKASSDGLNASVRLGRGAEKNAASAPAPSSPSKSKTVAPVKPKVESKKTVDTPRKATVAEDTDAPSKGKEEDAWITYDADGFRKVLEVDIAIAEVCGADFMLPEDHPDFKRNAECCAKVALERGYERWPGCGAERGCATVKHAGEEVSSVSSTSSSTSSDLGGATKHIHMDPSVDKGPSVYETDECARKGELAFSPVRAGVYVNQLKRFYEYVPPQNVLVVTADQAFSSGMATLAVVLIEWRMLGLPLVDPVSVTSDLMLATAAANRAAGLSGASAATWPENERGRRIEDGDEAGLSLPERDVVHASGMRAYPHWRGGGNGGVGSSVKGTSKVPSRTYPYPVPGGFTPMMNTARVARTVEEGGRRGWRDVLSFVEHIGTAGFHSWGWTGGASHARRVASELVRRAKSDVGVLNHHGHSHGRRSLLGGDAVVGSLGKVSRGKGGAKDGADVAKGAEGGAVPHEDSVDDAFFEDFSFSPGLRYFAALPDGFAVDSAIDPPTRAKLHAFYDPHVQALNALIGNGEIRWWDADGRDVAALQEETLLGDIREYESEQNERGEEELTGGVDPANFQEER
jgi:hypothetical protein